jgi:deoxyribonuclease V
MILAVDVDYRGDCAYVGGVTFEHWTDINEKDSYVSFLDHVNDYIPGKFYLRELPCILKLIEEHALKPDVIVIDGFVFLDNKGMPGLGKHLYDALSEKVTVIGVAKRPFKGITSVCEVFRGASKCPLYVTCAGITLGEAKNFIRSMHGKYRVPTLLKRVDDICRQSKR